MALIYSTDPMSNVAAGTSAGTSAGTCADPVRELSRSSGAARAGERCSDASTSDLLGAARAIDASQLQVELSVSSMRCGACIRSVEECLSRLPGVRDVRANLTTGRARVTWDQRADAPPLISELAAAGFPASLADEDALDVNEEDRALQRHVKALAVAGFAAGNVMMLSIGVWSGADPSVARLFHGISALIALPALMYAGRMFFIPAAQALRHGRVNMDVPIAVGIIVTALMSVYDMARSGEAVYFDAALMLVFFLLVGRTLELRMRARARRAADAVSRFEPRGATCELGDGSLCFVPLSALQPGDRVRLAAGERLAVDAVVEEGGSRVDNALVSGESAPLPVAVGAMLHAGSLNLDSPLRLRATADAEHSFLSVIRRTMREAENTKGEYRRVADRAASLYAPLVHTAALLTFIGWLLLGGDVYRALTVAVAVLIITCPCALGLAVPVVQVIAARRLFEHGVLVKDGAALERLADIDTVVFDKTGTLTTGRLVSSGSTEPEALAVARALASQSSHPFARALMQETADPSVLPWAFDGDVCEVPGAGLEAQRDGKVYRLGSAAWALRDEGQEAELDSEARASSSVLSREGELMARFHFQEELREDARCCLDALLRQAFDVEILSGDQSGPVARLADSVGVLRYRSDVLPGAKAEHVRQLERDGRHVLMVGDGLNDGPALASASVSIAPGSATDVGRQAADLVLLGDRLRGIPEALGIAHRAHRLVQQNMTLAVMYNVCAVPLAVAGWVTPLIAALSMSLSSVLVIANALRLTRGRAGSARQC